MDAKKPGGKIMNISEKIRKKIMKYELREPIFFEEIIKGIEDNKTAAYKAVNTLIKQGVINQFSKGIYYRPQSTRYGVLGINRELLIKEKYIGEYQEKGYITGPDVWNSWGLTTQVSKRKWIAQDTKRAYDNKNLNIFITKAKVEVRKEYVRVLQFLDVVDQLEKIPDTTNENTLRKLLNIYTDQFTPSEKINTFDLAGNYTKRVQILVGLIADTASIEDNYFEVILSKYKKTLQNSVSKRIKINVSPMVFNNNNEWRNEYDTTRIAIRF